MSEPGATHTLRSRAKADRRRAILDAAARLFAERGYNGVSIEELGAAAGVSGPALYRHFSGKQAMLSALLMDVSTDLYDGGLQVVAQSATALGALQSLVAFHVDFALTRPDVIRIQDRDLSSLAPADLAQVKELQRNYIATWVEQLRLVLNAGAGTRTETASPATSAASATSATSAEKSLLRFRVQATIGLINSTPHSARSQGKTVPRKVAGPILETMALAGLTAPVHS